MLDANSIREMGGYAHTIGKTFSKCQKNSLFFYHVCIDILCARSRFHGKPTFFVSCIKKIKKMSCAMPILAPKFIFFTHNKKISFSHETTL
jgi:hypothetical protein